MICEADYGNRLDKVSRFPNDLPSRDEHVSIALINTKREHLLLGGVALERTTKTIMIKSIRKGKYGIRIGGRTLARVVASDFPSPTQTRSH